MCLTGADRKGQLTMTFPMGPSCTLSQLIHPETQSFIRLSQREAASRSIWAQEPVSIAEVPLSLICTNKMQTPGPKAAGILPCGCWAEGQALRTACHPSHRGLGNAWQGAVPGGLACGWRMNELRRKDGVFRPCRQCMLK